MDFGGRKSGERDGGGEKRDRSDDDEHGQPSSKRESRRTLSDVARDTVAGITNTDESVPMDTGESDAQGLDVLLRKLPPEMRYKIYRGMSPSALNNLRSSSTFFLSDINGFEIYTRVDSPMRTLINLSRTISPFADAEVEKTTEWHKYNAIRVMQITQIPNPLHALLYVSRMKMLLTDNKFNEYIWKYSREFSISIGRIGKIAREFRVCLEPSTAVVGSRVPWALTSIRFAYTDRESESWRSKTSDQRLRDIIHQQTDVWNAIKKELEKINGTFNRMEIVLTWKARFVNDVKPIQLGIWSVDLGNQDISDDMILNLYDASQNLEIRDDDNVCGKISKSVFAVGSSTIYLQKHTNVPMLQFFESSNERRIKFPLPSEILVAYSKKKRSTLLDTLEDRMHLSLRSNDNFKNMTSNRGTDHKIFSSINIRDLYNVFFEYVDTTFKDDKYEAVRNLFSNDGNLYDMPLTLRRWTMRFRKPGAEGKHIITGDDIQTYVNSYVRPKDDQNVSTHSSTFKNYRESVTRNRKSMGVLRDIGMTSGSKPPLCGIGCENYAAFNCGSHGCSVNYCSVQCADTDWKHGHGMVCRDE